MKRAKPFPKIFVHCPEIDQVSTALISRADRMLSLPEREGFDLRRILAHRSILTGEAGSNAVKSILTDVDAAIERILIGHDAVRMMAAQRRVARSIDNDGSRYLGWVNGRRTAELAILKYANPTGLLDQTARSLVSWTFSEDELETIARLRALAILYYDLTGHYRRLGKGMSLRIARSWPLKVVPADTTSRKLDRLIEIWEERTRKNRTSITGVLGQHREANAAAQHESIIVAMWREAGEDDPVTLDSMTLEGQDVSFDVTFHSPSADLIADFGHLDQVVRVRHGVSMRALFEALRVVSLPAILQMRDGRVDGLAATLSLATLYRRGYTIGLWPSEDELRYRLDLLAQMRGEPAHPTDEIWRALKVASLEPATISLHDRSPSAPIYRFGSRYLYDAVAAGQFLVQLLRDLHAEDAVQRQADLKFEDQIHAKLKRFGHQPFASGRIIKMKGTHLTDLDASVVSHGVLIMADAYSSAKSTALDQGDFRATRNRASFLVKKAEAWLNKANIIAKEGGWDNLAVADYGITHIFPVVVTAAVEWLPDDSAKLWLDDDTPRVLTLTELIEHVEHLDPAALKNASIPVTGTRPTQKAGKRK